MINLNENERIDDLQFCGLKIIQDPEAFCFGIDSILLSYYASEFSKDGIICDLGTGNGILPILLSKKTNAKKIYGIEIQQSIAQMAKRSVKLNNLEDKIEIINDDINNFVQNKKQNIFDVVVTNPPYKKKGSGKKNESLKKDIARHETTATLEDFISVSNKILKDKGILYMVHRPDRLSDIFVLLRKYNLEPKKVRLVYPKIDEEPNLILIKAVKNAKPFVKFERPLIVYDNNGNYTEEILKIYNKI